MVISVSRAMHVTSEVCSSLTSIQRSLPSHVQPIFRHLTQVLNPPADGPGCLVAISNALLSVSAFRESLASHANDSLIGLVKEISILKNAIEELTFPPFSRQQMWRSLTRYPAWALFLEVPAKGIPMPVMEGIGAEFCWAWATSSRFSQSMATNLRRAIDKNVDLTCLEEIPVKQSMSAVRKATVIFRQATADLTAEAIATQFPLEIKQWFRNRLFFGSDKAQQAVPQHRTQSLVLAALRDIASGLDASVIALRSRRDVDWVNHLVERATALSMRLQQRFTRIVNTDERLIYVASELNSSKLATDFLRIDQEKFSGLRKTIGRMALDQSLKLANAWECAHAGIFIDLGDARVAESLFSCLAKSGVPSDRLVLSISSPNSESPDGAALVRESLLQLAYRNAFKVNALVDYKKYRRGRPRDYLVWSSTALTVEKMPASASLSIGGYNALIFALVVFLEMAREDKQ